MPVRNEQEMRANVDLEFVLHLLNLAGSLLPELTSEEVLAKMSRKKAKLAVRHTVRGDGGTGKEAAERESKSIVGRARLARLEGGVGRRFSTARRR